jgi:hypothetical protein
MSGIWITYLGQGLAALGMIFAAVVARMAILRGQTYIAIADVLLVCINAGLIVWQFRLRRRLRALRLWQQRQKDYVDGRL